MKQRTLATAALLVTTLLANLGAVKAVQDNRVTGEPDGRTGNAASEKLNLSNESGELSNMLLMVGAGVAVGVVVSRSSKASERDKSSSRTTDFKRLEDKPENIKEFGKALTLNSSDAFSCIERTNSFCEPEDEYRAIIDLNEAIRLNPQSANLYSERAKFRQKKLGDKQGAIEDYTNAIRLNPQNALFYLWRSQTHNALGNKQRAIEDYNAAIRLAPEDTIYYSS